MMVYKMKERPVQSSQDCVDKTSRGASPIQKDGERVGVLISLVALHSPSFMVYAGRVMCYNYCISGLSGSNYPETASADPLVATSFYFRIGIWIGDSTVNNNRIPQSERKHGK